MHAHVAQPEFEKLNDLPLRCLRGDGQQSHGTHRFFQAITFFAPAQVQNVFDDAKWCDFDLFESLTLILHTNSVHFHKIGAI